MADDAPSQDEVPITFNVKSSSDAKYVITVPLTTSVLDLKKKLAGSDFANVPPESQRLIYSGRVLKDADTLASNKVKEGTTIHLVKSAASNARQNPAGSSTNSTAAGSPPAPGVPTNMAAGTGRDPFASLTGARYAGYAQMPNASMFGPDGGMGPPPDPEQIASMLENPAVAAQMNAALSDPNLVEQLIRSNPMLSGPMGQQARQMLNDPNMRRLLFNPEVMRSMSQMRRQFGGTDGFGGPQRGGNAAFPMPGSAEAGEQPSNTQAGQAGQQDQTQGNTAQDPPNPFTPFGLGLPPGGAPAGAPGANPFAALFGGMAPPAQGAATTNRTDSDSQQQQTPPSQGQGAPPNPFQMAQEMYMQNPQYMQQMMAALGGGTNPTNPTNPSEPDAHSTQQPFNPFAGFHGLNPAMFGGGGSPQPPDDRPPEDRFAEQLRQLNDMGFYSFERNVEALRRTGGSVQGAIEYLLSQP